MKQGLQKYLHVHRNCIEQPCVCACTEKYFCSYRHAQRKTLNTLTRIRACAFVHSNAALTSHKWQVELAEHCLEGFVAGMKRPPAWSLMKHYHKPSLFWVKPLPGAISNTAIYTTLVCSSVIHRGLPEEETDIFQILIRTLLQWTSTGSCINNWSPSYQTLVCFFILSVCFLFFFCLNYAVVLADLANAEIFYSVW